MKLELIDFKELKYPSGSGIEYFDGKIYIIGDDAGSILVTNRRWKNREEIILFETTEARIPKKEKADLEASTIVHSGKTTYLLLLGSGSKELRNKGILYNIVTGEKEEFDFTVFYNRLKSHGITELNIEGAAQINKHLIFCNRGNKTNPGNQLIMTDIDFYKKQETAAIEIQDIKMLKKEGAIGISGLAYSPEHDMLLFTTSTENTKNSVDDGPIGKSYLGIIENAAWKIGRERMKVNELIDLEASDKGFAGYKVESVCVQNEKNRSMKIQLVADNDTGETYLFKAVLSLT